VASDTGADMEVVVAYGIVDDTIVDVAGMGMDVVGAVRGIAVDAVDVVGSRGNIRLDFVDDHDASSAQAGPGCCMDPAW